MCTSRFRAAPGVAWIMLLLLTAVPACDAGRSASNTTSRNVLPAERDNEHPSTAGRQSATDESTAADDDDVADDDDGDTESESTESSGSRRARGPMSPSSTAAEGPPNFIVIIADDLGFWQYLKHRKVMPNLTQLARTGIQFDCCWATPMCCPSRVELMTGRYGTRTGWTGQIGQEPWAPEFLDPNETTFADVLKSKGYATGLAGKWHLGKIRERPEMIYEHGFDEYCIWAQLDIPKDAPWRDPTRRFWHPTIIENGKLRPTKRDEYGPDLFSDWIVDFVERNREKPFLAYYAMCLPHQPWDPTPDLKNPGQRTEGGEEANLEYMDHLIGKIVRAVNRAGVRNRTVIMFAGENGPAGFGKGKAIEPGVRVPLIVNLPGWRQRGERTDELIDFTDVLPTMADLAGIQLPGETQFDGQSFGWLLRQKPGKPRDWIFTAGRDKVMLRDRNWLLTGDGRFFDCSTAGIHVGEYVDVTDSTDPNVIAARERFRTILAGLPAAPKIPDVPEP